MAKEELPSPAPSVRGTLRINAILDVDIDLKLTFAGTFLSVFCIFLPYINETLLRAGAGLLLCLFLPGYALGVVLFPSTASLRGVPRIALSFGLSLVITPVMAIIVNSSPWGITLPSLALSLGAFTLISIAVAHYRRQRVPRAERPIYTFLGKRDKSFFARYFVSQNRFNKTLSIVLVSLIVASGAGLIVYSGIGTSNSSQSYTQLYILDASGGTINYPLHYTLGAQQPVIVGITNHESKSMQYNLVLIQNGSSGSKQLYSKRVVLPDNTTWQNAINIKPTAVGELKMEFLLFTGSNSSAPYREVYLWANVTK
jgi:uncharacterized membrane protein